MLMRKNYLEAVLASLSLSGNDLLIVTYFTTIFLHLVSQVESRLNGVSIDATLASTSKNLIPPCQQSFCPDSMPGKSVVSMFLNFAVWEFVLEFLEQGVVIFVVVCVVIFIAQLSWDSRSRPHPEPDVVQEDRSSRAAKRRQRMAAKRIAQQKNKNKEG